MEKQKISIGLAKNLLDFVNGVPPRYVKICGNLALFINAISEPCYAEGGDHYFVHTLESKEKRRYGKTSFSLKDQPSHKVGSILGSINTDLLHHSFLDADDAIELEESISILNDELCSSKIFTREDFFISINAEIDHKTLTLRYVLTGHPPLLIRGSEITPLPKPGDPGNNLPIAVQKGIEYSAGECQLRENDKLILYTDGLTEMPLKNLNKRITNEELKKIISEIISKDPELPVSDIMYTLLDRIATLSNEEIVPTIKNTSGDDITILGLEIEKTDTYNEEIWKPHDSDEISKLMVGLYTRLEQEWHQQSYESPDIRLRSVLEEAISNAWIHGNKRNRDKAIILRWRFGNDFHLEVIDHGRGFNYESVPDPRLDANLTKPSGRGLFIIRKYANTAVWTNDGKHLIASFKKNPHTI